MDACTYRRTYRIAIDINKVGAPSCSPQIIQHLYYNELSIHPLLNRTCRIVAMLFTMIFMLYIIHIHRFTCMYMTSLMLYHINSNDYNAAIVSDFIRILRISKV